MRAEDAREVRLDGLLADVQAAGDELVRQALDHQGQHLALARRQIARGVRAHGRRQQGARGARVQRRLAAGGRADAALELRRRRVLQEVADGAGVERLQDARAVGERGEDHDRRRRVAPRGCAASSRCRRARGISRSISTTSAPCSASAASASSPAAGGRHDLDALEGADQLAEPRAHHGVVVADQDPDHAGTSTSSTVPSPGAERTSALPAQVGREVLDQGEAEVALLAAPLPGRRVEARARRPPRAGGRRRRPRATRTLTRVGSACAPALRRASTAAR